jgi:ribosomal protein S18 acetylase RimI-like enzyme
MVPNSLRAGSGTASAATVIGAPGSPASRPSVSVLAGADGTVGSVTIRYRWRGEFTDVGLNELYAEGFGHAFADGGWWERVNRHSLGWVCARDGSDLVGFVNVAWDGGIHAFVLDAAVALRVRRRGVGAALIDLAERESRAAGCQWLHVDFDHM